MAIGKQMDTKARYITYVGAIYQFDASELPFAIGDVHEALIDLAAPCRHNDWGLFRPQPIGFRSRGQS